MKLREGMGMGREMVVVVRRTKSTGAAGFGRVQQQRGSSARDRTKKVIR